MKTIREKIHELIDRTSDLVLLENIYNYLEHAQKPSGSKKDILDELSEADLISLREAQAEARRGETIPHEEVMRKMKERFGLG